jgi:hypothetical protein
MMVPYVLQGVTCDTFQNQLLHKHEKALLPEHEKALLPKGNRLIEIARPACSASVGYSE